VFWDSRCCPFPPFASTSDSNTISIWNNGKGIPVVEHKDEKMYVPALIFGHLLTSSNYDDDEKKVTGERRRLRVGYRRKSVPLKVNIANFCLRNF